MPSAHRVGGPLRPVSTPFAQLTLTNGWAETSLPVSPVEHVKHVSRCFITSVNTALWSPITAVMGYARRCCSPGEGLSRRRPCSRRGLHRLEIGEDTPERVVAQDALPHGHALVQAPVIHRLIVDLRRLLTVADLQPAKVPGTLSLDGVGAVAMRAVLVEQPPAVLDQVTPPFEGIRHRGRSDLGGLGRGPREKRQSQNGRSRTADERTARRAPPGSPAIAIHLILRRSTRAVSSPARTLRERPLPGLHRC